MKFIASTLLLAAIALTGCSTRSERAKANEWYLDLLFEKNHRFTISADSVTALRDRFRLWNECYGRSPIERDSPSEMSTTWPREEGADGGYRIAMIPFGDSARVTVETSDSNLRVYDRAFALYIRRATLPPPTDHLYRECVPADNSSATE